MTRVLVALGAPRRGGHQRREQRARRQGRAAAAGHGHAAADSAVVTEIGLGG